MGDVESTRLRSSTTPRGDEPSGAIEPKHTGHTLAVALGDEDVAGWTNRDVGRLVEESRLCRLVPIARLVAYAEPQQDLAIRTEFGDRVSSIVNRPDAAVAVQPHSVRPRIGALAERPYECAGAIELRNRMRAAIEDEQVATRIDCQARGRAQTPALREREPDRDRPVTKVRRRLHLGGV